MLRSSPAGLRERSPGALHRSTGRSSAASVPRHNFLAVEGEVQPATAHEALDHLARVVIVVDAAEIDPAEHSARRGERVVGRRVLHERGEQVVCALVD